jgi:hypothetical protein
MRFYTTESLGATQELTPEGYLLCKDVAIARAGPHLYAPGEVPVRSKDGMIRIERDPSELFRRETMLSFEGKPITLDHPDEDVDPTNWKTLAKGTLHNVHQGASLENDLLLADLLITDREAIQKVTTKELREVSLGYDADYEELEPGLGRQTNFYGNHLALVPRGRCGSRCAIGDSMKNIKFLDRVRAAFKARDEAALETALKDDTSTNDAEEETEEEKKKREKQEADDKEDKKKTSDSLARLATAVEGFGTRLTKLETRDAEEESDEDKKKRLKKEKDDQDEKDGKTGDSAALAEEVQDVFARAEILSPGISMPTFDAKATPQRTRDAMCALRLKAVKNAFEGSFKDAITPFLGQAPNFTSLTCDAVRSAFIGASEIARRGNNTHVQGTFDGAQAAKGVAKQITEINKANAAFWKRGGA